MLMDEQTNERGSVAALAAEYQAGSTLDELAVRHGIGTSTVVRRLNKAGVARRQNRQRATGAHPAAHRVIRQLADLVLEDSQRRLLKTAGVSPTWWRDARRGRRSPNLADLEAMANAAGYELVLRRRAS